MHIKEKKISVLPLFELVLLIYKGEEFAAQLDVFDVLLLELILYLGHGSGHCGQFLLLGLEQQLELVGCFLGGRRLALTRYQLRIQVVYLALCGQQTAAEGTEGMKGIKGTRGLGQKLFPHTHTQQLGGTGGGVGTQG
jgi:hypothetical protein